MGQGGSSCHCWLKAVTKWQNKGTIFAPEWGFLEESLSNLWVQECLKKMWHRHSWPSSSGWKGLILFLRLEGLFRQWIETFIGKKTPSFASCVSSLFLILMQSTLFPSFPVTKQHCDPSWVPYHLTQFSQYLPGDSIRFYRPRAQSHETAPHFRWQQQTVKSPGYLQLLSNLATN